jgi:hypothetical protein
MKELSPIQQRLEKRQCQPGEHYVDAGYMSGPNLKDSQVRAIDLIGPLPTIVTPQDRLPEGITQAQFQVDIQNMCVTCPQGLPLRTPPRWVTACVFSSRNRSVLLVNYALGVVQEKRVELSGSAPIMNKSGQLAADKKPKPSKRTTIFTIVAWKAPGPPWCAVMAYG